MSAIPLGCNFVHSPVISAMASEAYGDAKVDTRNPHGVEAVNVPREVPFQPHQTLKGAWAVRLTPATVGDDYPVILQAALRVPSCFLDDNDEGRRPAVALAPNPSTMWSESLVQYTACDLRVLRSLAKAQPETKADGGAAVISLEPLLAGGALCGRVLGLVLTDCPLGYTGPPPVLEIHCARTYPLDSMHHAGVLRSRPGGGHMNPISLIVPGTVKVLTSSPPLEGTDLLETAMSFECPCGSASGMVLEGLPASTTAIRMRLTWGAPHEPTVLDFSAEQALATGLLDFTVPDAGAGADTSADFLARAVHGRLAIPFARADTVELIVTCATIDAPVLSTAGFRTWILAHNLLAIVPYGLDMYSAGVLFSC